MKRWWRGWVALLDHREPAESLAAARILAAATVLYTLAHAWWSGVATTLWVMPSVLGAPVRFPGGVIALLVVTLVAAALMGVGALTPAAAIATWLGFRALVFSNPASGGSGDDVLSNALFLLMLSGSGRAWSLDARWFGKREVPAWPRYLLIGQLATIYISAGWHKMSASWVPGGSLDAVWYSLQNPLWQRRAYAWLAPIGRLTQLLTLTTWLFEVGAPLLLLAFYFRATRERGGRLRGWFNRVDFRLWYLAVGVGIHLGIELTMEVGAFFGGMMSLYACCMHPSEWPHKRS